MRVAVGVTILWVACSATAAGAAEPRGDAPAGVSFSRDVAPILVQKCQGCHGPRKQQGGYRVDTFEQLMRPGDSEAAPVRPGKPGESELFRLISSGVETERMPKRDDPLTPSQRGLVAEWIALGGVFDGPDRGAPIQSLVKVSHPSAPASYPHPVPAVALAIRPDGKAVAVGGYHEITEWDVESGRLIRRIGDVARQTHGLAYSPDGSALAAAGGTPGSLGELRVFDTSEPRKVRVFDRIGDVMLSASFSPDGKRLATGGSDGTVRVYDVAGGNRTLLVEPHADWVTAVAFAPDGARVASASRDKSARVFDIATGETLSAYLGHEESLFALAWSPDGKRVYTAGRDREIHAWEPAVEAKKLREIKGSGGDVLRLAVVGNHLYSTSADGKVRQHERSDGKLLRTVDVTADYLTGLSADASHNLLAAGAFDGRVHLFDMPAVSSKSSFLAVPGH